MKDISWTRVALGVTLLCVLLVWGAAEDLKASDWASWVQALGSICAILGAVFLGDRQAREARVLVEKQVHEARRLEANKRHLDDLLKTEIILALFDNGSKLCDALAIVPTLRVPAPPTVYRAIAQLNTLAESFRALPTFELPGSGIAVGVLSAPKVLGELAEATRACTDALIKLAGHQSGEVPSRTRVEFDRSHEQAAGTCRFGVLACRHQISKLRALMPVED